MLPKCFSLLVLIVATQFSQGFAAPRDEITQATEVDSTKVNTESILQPVNELLPTEQPTNPAAETVDSKPTNVAEVVDGVAAQPAPTPEQVMDVAAPSIEGVTENMQNLAQPASAPLEGAVNSDQSEEAAQLEKPEEHLSHMLTREQELNILHQVPEFTQIIRAMEALPDCIYGELKSFLESVVPRMPADNLFTQHFKNAEILIHMFERLVKVARTGAVFKPSSKALFHRVHRAAPAMKKEMDQFNGFIADTQSRLATLGTSTNPMSQLEQPPTAGANVAAGSVSLPVPEKSESFAGEFAVPSSE